MLFTASISSGLDTDLYVLSGVDIPPNVLIILDNSASMSDASSGQDYRIDGEYFDWAPYVPSGKTVYPADKIYYKSGNQMVEWGYNVNTVICPNLKDLLQTEGIAQNFNVNLSTSACPSPCTGCTKKDFKTGNYLNFEQVLEGPSGSRNRFGLSVAIIRSYINTTSGVRFPVMTFNNDISNKKVLYNENTKVEYVLNPDGSEDALGGRLLGFVDENKNGKTALFNNLSGLKNETWSPLAETLYEAGVYFQGGTSAITGTSYANSSPVQYYCQKNYVLIISDGNPTKDTHPVLSSAIGDLTNDGNAGRLDDVAKYLRSLDLSGGQSSTGQNVKVYTIGFSITHSLLESTARNGGGKYFYVWSSQSFSIAFQTFITEILQENVSYVAPVVPISQMERSSSGNRMYLAMFQPTMNSFWNGNIKKYGIATYEDGKIVDGNLNPVTDPNIKVGDILDADGSLVMSSENQIKKTARSYWSSAVDGEEVNNGGIGSKLLNQASRNIYTYLGTNTNLTDSSNAFISGVGSPITPAMLGLSAGDTTGRDKIINFIHGFDAYNDFGAGTDRKREWILGAFIHSRPLIIHYGQNQSVVYAGANDGMLHAFDDDSGEELWAFIPPNLLNKLQNLRGESLQFFVDGAPKAYLERDGAGTLTKAILIFGQRRGGDRYIALDIKNPVSPKFLWEISPTSITFQTNVTNTTDYQKIMQTWCTPQLGKIKYGAGEKWVTFIGGGYDVNQDSSTPANEDSKGTAVYVVDISNGNLIWSYSKTQNAAMKYCIPSDIARVDTDGNGYIDRLYVGDIGGQIWGFDIGDPDCEKWTGRIIFNSNPGVDGTTGRKIFYPPDVTLEKGNYEMLFFGTGDREHPKATNTVNRLYAIKDRGLSTLNETNLYDATDDLLQTGDATEINKLNSKEGWFIKLIDNLGEKCLSNTVIFHGVAYFTTFTPEFGQGGDICFLGEGKGRLYALEYKTGNAVFNLDLTNDTGGTVISRSDRSEIIGPSIPSGVIITVIGEEAVAYAGSGGGVGSPELPIKKTLVPINWRIVF